MRVILDVLYDEEDLCGRNFEKLARELRFQIARELERRAKLCRPEEQLGLQRALEIIEGDD